MRYKKDYSEEGIRKRRAKLMSTVKTLYSTLGYEKARDRALTNMKFMGDFWSNVLHEIEMLEEKRNGVAKSTYIPKPREDNGA